MQDGGVATPDDLRASIARLEALRAVEQLKYRYTQACDSGFDLDAIADCFVPDGRWVSDGYADCRGHDAIRRYFAAVARATPMAQHHATNPQIELDADGARATSRFHLFCVCTTTVPERAAVVIIGAYRDRCVKVGDDWLYEELRADIRHVSEWTRGWVDQPWLMDSGSAEDEA
jgi:ketosteroid isomerase-like protein